MKEGVEDLTEKAFPSTLPIVSFLPGDDNVEKAVFHHENLAVALKGCEDIPVLVASVTGVFRSGKSFLLNLMVTYLEHHKQSVSSQGSNVYHHATHHSQNVCLKVHSQGVLIAHNL